MSEPAYVQKLDEIYTEDHLEKFKNYLITCAALDHLGTLDKECYDLLTEANNMRSGSTGSRPDEETAYAIVCSTLTTPMNRAFLAKYDSTKMKEEVTRICEESIAYYRELLSTEEWLSDETRKKAVEKLDAIWNFDILETNAYYEPLENSINIIRGILGGVFYREDMTTEELYAGIGCVIGHEISHAFDTSGAQFDATGALNDWWTKEDYAAFLGRAQKLIDRVEKLTGAAVNKTSPDGLFSLDATRCLGACGLAPVCIIDGKYYGNALVDSEFTNEIRRIVREEKKAGAKA